MIKFKLLINYGPIMAPPPIPPIDPLDPIGSASRLNEMLKNKVDEAADTILAAPEFRNMLIRRENLAGDPQADDKIRAKMHETTALAAKIAQNPALIALQDATPEERYQK